MVPQIAQVLEAISDDTSFNIIDIIMINSQTADSLIDKLNIPRNKFFERTRKLIAMGMVRRKGLTYSITSFGRVMYEAQLKVAKAAQRSSTLKMIDVVMKMGLPEDAYSRLIHQLIDDFEITNLILKHSQEYK
jgi:hypothetical protein